MLYVLDNTTDITQYVEEGSVQISQTLTNRVDTAQFTTIGSQKVNYGHSIYIYEGIRLAKTSASGTNVLYVDDVFSDTGKWLYRTDIIVDIGGSPVSYTISSVSAANKTITLTTNLLADATITTKCGRLLFGGVATKPAEKETSVSGTSASTLEYAVQCTDWTALLNRQNVIQEYQTMYIREIIGRVLYTFCAFDSTKNIDLFESAWGAQAGTAIAMANDTNRLQGSYSQHAGTTGNGTATWTQTFSALDISVMKHLRWWWMVNTAYASSVSAMGIRIGADASNYFEYDLTNIGASYGGCWNFESAILSTYSSKTGSPNLNNIAWAQLFVTASAAIPAGNIFFDHLFASTGGFTIQNTTLGTNTFADVRVPFLAPSQLFSDLCKAQALFWYIDPNKDIHVTPVATAAAAPWSITDSSTNYVANTLIVTPDITKLRNRVTVLAGDAPSTTTYTQTKVADGSQTSFTLDYKPTTLTMTVGGVSQTIGEENFVDPTTVQWLFNFQNRIVKKTPTTATPTNGAVIVFTYLPNYPIIVRLTSPASIATMKSLTGGDGVYDGPVINEPTITNFADAITRGNAELTQYANALVTVNFDTQQDGLQVGQLISITDTTRGMSAQQFLIQKIDIKQRQRDRWHYAVTACSTLFGLVEFLQLLLKQSNTIGVSPSQYFASVMNHDEAITFSDSEVLVVNSKVAQATKKVIMSMDFNESGTISAAGAIDTGKMWYANFTGGESGTALLDASSHYNNGHALKLTTTVGGSGAEAYVQSRPKIVMPSATSVTIDAWVEITAALTNVVSGGFKLLVKEYSAADALLATNTIFSGLTAVQDFNALTATFTTNASTTYIRLYISMYQAAGTASIAHITINAATTETAVPPGVANFSQAS